MLGHPFSDQRGSVHCQPVVKHFLIKIVSVAEVVVEPTFGHVEARCKAFDPHRLDTAFGKNIECCVEPIRLADTSGLPRGGLFYVSLRHESTI